MIQTIIITLLFVAALAYLGRSVYTHFTTKEGCAKGCGSCSAVDIEKIKKQIQEQHA
uniref:FeoB-associated Cys-rich membrane protein n=1 Tax=Roseihalotalea indica TaxID=2867963 RepID=A0AA49GQJ2_9BACT|nr:FeoB-associated Cys-rich membrane protein [Tunicatimonas sp. TK19036]